MCPSLNSATGLAVAASPRPNPTLLLTSSEVELVDALAQLLDDVGAAARHLPHELLHVREVVGPLRRRVGRVLRARALDLRRQVRTRLDRKSVV